MGKIEILDPYSEPKPQLHSLAPRPGDLNGKVIGILDNTKANAAEVLDEIQAKLMERFSFAEVIRKSQPPHRVEGTMTSLLAELADRCDVVVTGVGD
ncbi:MAG: hypothetical protein HYX92_18800 [Chloroflexi bacterium]|nr:hypothetical protein [Chloroflexota bacterium]